MCPSRGCLQHVSGFDYEYEKVDKDVKRLIRPGALIPVVVSLVIAGRGGVARADLPTPGYPEPIVQWGVQKGETCEDIAKILYGSAAQSGLVLRYNRVPCGPGVPLPEGKTLVLPASATTVPDAELRSMNPDVRVRPAGGGWSTAAAGVPLYTNYNVNTLDKGRADIEFIDRSRVFLAPNTLVIIYGTASRTRVSKTPPPSVEIEAGEVKAGLSALRGDPVEIAVKGGGAVTAASREAVVERKGERTTVAVFDGSANVRSGGKAVLVPKNYGTRFVGVSPPIPPRPLPPAPAWEAGGSGAVVLAPKGSAVLSGAWATEPSAVKYRFEIARDEAFHDLVAREEVPADVRSFRAEKMPPGVYYMSVRAIDKEEYLGVAASVRAIRVVEAALDAGTVGGKEIEANPYGVLALAPSPGLQLAVDEGPFGPPGGSIDLQKRAPERLRFRAGRGEGEETITIRYTPVRAVVEPSAEGDGRAVSVRVRFEGFEGIDIPKRVAPSLRVRWPSGAQAIALAPSPSSNVEMVASFSAAGEGRSLASLRMDVVDGRGLVLGTGELPGSAPPLDALGPPKAPSKTPRIGPDVPIIGASTFANLALRSPTARSAFALGGMVEGSEDGTSIHGHVRAVGAIDPVGVDASIAYAMSGDEPSDTAAWLGVRYRALRLGDARLELGPSLRAALPVTPESAPLRLEPAIAGGGVSGAFTWLVNLGGRLRLQDDGGRSGTPLWQTFALVGASVDAAPWLRATAFLDGYVFGGGRAFSGGGGLSAGLEAGTMLFGGFWGRVSPGNEGGVVMLSAELTLGVREP